MSLAHLRSKLTVLTYVRIADEITANLKPGARILDWGTGYGQMTYLLRERGFDVVSYVHEEHLTGDEGQPGEISFGGMMLPVVFGSEAVKLPFKDREFHAVLSSGVLEHVPDDAGSLDEIHRVLRPNGRLFVYQLPQKGSWMEFLIKRFKLGYAHERKYSGRGVRKLLRSHGYRVETWRRANMLPKNFTGLPGGLKALFEKRPAFVLRVDNLLAHVPVLNYIGGILEVVAVKA